MHFLIVFYLFFSFAVWAQDNGQLLDVESLEPVAEKDAVEPPLEKKSIEKTKVAGSRIKQLDKEGHTPVLSLDQEYLEKTGYNAVGDVLRELSVNNFGSWREQSEAALEEYRKSL